MLTADAIRKAQAAIPRRTVLVPDWDGEVVVRGMTGRERDEFDLAMGRSYREKTPARDVRARTLVRLIEGGDGKPLLSEADVIPLSAGPARPLSLLWDAVAELSGITEATAKEEEKNSELAPNAAPG